MEAGEAMFGDEGLLDKLGDVETGVDGARASVEDAFQKFQEALPDDMKGNYSDIKVNEEGHYQMKIGDKEVDLTSLKDKFNTGDVEGALKDMGVSDEQLNSEEGKEFIQKEKERIDQGEGGKIRIRMNDNRDFAKEAEKAGLKEPQNYEEFKQMCDEQGWDIDKQNEIFKEAMKDVEDPPTEPEAKKKWAEKVKDKLEAKDEDGMFKKFFKDNWLKIIVVALLAYLAKDLYDFINNIRHALSGCFATTQNSHCKIRALTCNKKNINIANSDLFDSPSVSLCYPCEDLKCTDRPGEAVGAWVPLKLKEQCSCDPTGKAPYPGRYVGDVYNPPTVGYNSCNGKNTGKCPITESFEATPACTNASGCVSKNEACPDKSADCSNWCSTDYIHTLPGQTISCQSCSFWCAFKHVAGDIFKLPAGILKGLEKLLLQIVIALVAIIVIYWILRMFIGWATSKKETKGGDKVDAK